MRWLADKSSDIFFLFSYFGKSVFFYYLYPRVIMTIEIRFNLFDLVIKGFQSSSVFDFSIYLLMNY